MTLILFSRSFKDFRRLRLSIPLDLWKNYGGVCTITVGLRLGVTVNLGLWLGVPVPLDTNHAIGLDKNHDFVVLITNSIIRIRVRIGKTSRNIRLKSLYMMRCRYMMHMMNCIY